MLTFGKRGRPLCDVREKCGVDNDGGEAEKWNGYHSDQRCQDC